MLIPGDLARIPSPLLRARLLSHLLDEPRGDEAALGEMMAGALTQLIAAGCSVTEIAADLGLDERRVRRLVTRVTAA